ncbi:MAG: YkvA family protein [Acidimicrobiia bacterium]|nr:YkvA family protein [Acidimicrobiia bacterium]
MSDPLRPDEVITPSGGASAQMRKLASDAVYLLPNLVKLLGRLVKDPRVPRRSKVVIGAALAYLVSPVDLIPEFVPVIGFADDVLLVSYAINHLITVAGEDVVLEHWDGPRDMLELVRSVLEVASDLVPPQLKRLIGRLSGA